MPDPPDPLAAKPKRRSGPSFKRFFTRGLGVLLPTLITFGLVVWAYGMVSNTIAEPINRLIRFAIVEYTPFPAATDRDFDEIFEQLDRSIQRDWEKVDDINRLIASQNNRLYTTEQSLVEQRDWLRQRPEAVTLARRHHLLERWDAIRIGEWVVTDLIGIAVAIVLIFVVGVFLSNLVGRRLVNKSEELIARLPLVRRVYPSVKQVTDFFFGESETPIEFNRVVAVQYPRKGLWSVGLVTGSTMKRIQQEAGAECLTVFVPSSPTPFTGYVITVPVHDTIDLNISIEDALKFAVSGGVLIPPSQQITEASAAVTDLDPDGTTDQPDGSSKPTDTPQPVPSASP
ncbi:MAG: DUF502 domain-containing protein [Planctomycetota bacterium]